MRTFSRWVGSALAINFEAIAVVFVLTHFPFPPLEFVYELY